MPRLTGAIHMPYQTAPSAGISGRTLIYVKSDGKVYAKDAGGVEYDLTPPANYETTDTAQTISALKTFNGPSTGATAIRIGDKGAVGSGTTNGFYLTENVTTVDNGVTYQAIATGASVAFGALNGVFNVWTAPSVAAGTNASFTQRLSVANTGMVTAQGWSSTGMTGATGGGTRLVGSTTSGAPTTGTFSVGDFVTARDGHQFICVTAGSPGTWVEAAPTNMMTLDTAQNVTNTKTFNLATGSTGVTLATTTVASGGATVQPSPRVQFNANYWTGAASATKTVYLQAAVDGAGQGAGTFDTYLSTFNGTGFTAGLIRATSMDASNPARFVGGTASGAPSSGTWYAGDFSIDRTGKVWVCTVGGTPGTWVNAGAGGGAVSSVNTRTGAVTGLAEDNTVVHLTGAESVAGVKTFTSVPVFPSATVTMAQINATGTPSATTYLRGDGTWSTPAGSTTTDLVLPGTGGNNWRVSVDTTTGALITTTTVDPANVAIATNLSAPANMMTTDTIQTVSAAKYFTGSTGTTVVPVAVMSSDTGGAFTGYGLSGTTVHYVGVHGTGSTTFTNAATDDMIVVGKYGSTLRLGLHASATPTATTSLLDLSGTQVKSNVNLYEGANRVYSAGNLVPIAGISATGTASGTTYLRGDGTWSAVSGGAAAATTLKTTTYTAVAGDVILANGTFVITLPAASTTAQVTIKNIGTGVITVDPPGATTLDGLAAWTLDIQYESITAVSDGTNWFVI